MLLLTSVYLGINILNACRRVCGAGGLFAHPDNAAAGRDGDEEDDQTTSHISSRHASTLPTTATHDEDNDEAKAGDKDEAEFLRKDRELRYRGRGQTVATAVVVSDSVPTKPECDLKDYRVLRLNNHVRVLLIHDPGVGQDDDDDDDDDDDWESGSDSESEGSQSGTQSKDSRNGDDDESDDDDDNDDDDDDAELPAAVALSVAVGTFADPPEAPGLAHFLEHMVFMGSEKYTDEDALENYLQHHGGYSNAHTETEQTCFYFDVQRQYLADALDLFAQFFIDPIMKPNSLERECEAVESEFQMAQQDDYCRFQQILSAIAIEGSPISQFSWGNKESLSDMPTKAGVDIRELLFSFKNKYYVGENMCCVIRSKHSLDELQEMAVKTLSGVPTHLGPLSPEPTASSNNSDAARLLLQRENKLNESFGHSMKILRENNVLAPVARLWERAQLHSFITAIPVRQIHELVLYWSLPSTQTEWRNKPLSYISELMGHEGVGSVLHELLRQDLCTALSAGNAGSGLEMSSHHSSFQVAITLTEHGLENIERVVFMVIEYLQMLRNHGVDERFCKETKQIYNNAYRFQNDSEPVDFVEAVACEMPLYDDEHILSGDEIVIDYDADVINRYLDLLVFENMGLLLFSPTLEDKCTQSEKWTGVAYGVQPFDETWESRAKDIESEKHATPSYLHMPAPNTYIATEFAMKEKTDSFKDPVLLVNDADFELWHLHDAKYPTPRSAIGLTLSSLLCVNTPQNAVYTHFLEQLIVMALKEELYPATIADVSYSFRVDEMGMSVSLKGFDSVLSKALERILSFVFAPFDIEENFAIVKEKLVRSFTNAGLSPDNYARDLRLRSLMKTVHAKAAMADIAANVTAAEVAAFHSALLSNHKAILFSHGNFTQDDALATKALVEKYRRKTGTRVPIRQHVLVVPKGLSMLKKENKNSQDNTNTLELYLQIPKTSVKARVLMNLLENIVSEPMFQELRTKQQLGYRVHFSRRNTFGRLGWAVQLSCPSDRVSSTEMLQKTEEFLANFLDELEAMSEDDFESQVEALHEQLLTPESNTSREFNRLLYCIRSRQFDFRMKDEARELEAITHRSTVAFYKKYILPASKERRALAIIVTSAMDEVADADGKDSTHTIGTGNYELLTSRHNPTVIDKKNKKLVK